MMPSRYTARALGHLRRSGQSCERFIEGNAHRVAYDAVDAPTLLVEYAPELRAIEDNWPKIKFHTLREHAGLVFQKQPATAEALAERVCQANAKNSGEPRLSMPLASNAPA